MTTTPAAALCLYLQAKRASGWSIREVAQWGHISTTTAWRIVKNVPVTGSNGRGWPDRKGKRKPPPQD